MEEKEISWKETCLLLSRQTLPRWEELPDLELYMDQVLSLVARYLGSYPGVDSRGLTASMVNNYVKAGVMPAPVRKKYTRTHLAHLLMVCILKQSLPLSVVKRMLAEECAAKPVQEFYNEFCGLFESSVRTTAETYGREEEEKDPSSVLCSAALRAQAEQALALRLAAETFPETE